MKLEKVKGIIIHQTNFQESSKILHVFTYEYGKIGIISKGCRKYKSKLRSVSNRLIYGYFYIYYKKEGLSTLISVDVLDEFVNIKKDLEKISYATYLLDLTNQLLKSDNTNKDIFNILISSLLKINEGYDPLIITNIVEMKYLKYLGVMPILDGCLMCFNTNDIITFSIEKAGFICKNCYNNEPLLDLKIIKLLRIYSLIEIDKIKQLDIKEKNKIEISRLIEEYYNKYTGLYLKSKDILLKINNVNRV